MNEHNIADAQLVFRDLTVHMLAVMESKMPVGTLGEGRVVYVTSAVDREGKTFISQFLAKSAAEMIDGNVLLIDGNFKNPQLYERFSVSVDMPGFSDLIVGGSSIIESTEFPEVEKNLFLLAAGVDCREGLLYKRDTIKKIFSALTDMYSLIIVDGASLGASGANSVPYIADGVALVVDAVNTQREVIRNSLDHLAIDQDHFIGSILNKKRRYIPRFLY